MIAMADDMVFVFYPFFKKSGGWGEQLIPLSLLCPVEGERTLPSGQSRASSYPWDGDYVPDSLGQSGFRHLPWCDCK